MIKKSKFRIGVVIVNYNSGDYLRRCIQSLSKSHAPLDIVVVDNHSHDGSHTDLKSQLKRPHRILLVKNGENIGFSRAVNQGVLKLRNRYVVLLNPDCTVFPDSLLMMQQTMILHKKNGIVGATVFNPEGTEQRGCRRNEPTFSRSMVTALGLGKRFEGVDLTYQHFPSKPIAVDAVSGAAMMVRRAYFDEIGGMDEDFFLHCEDLDICRRMRDYGYNVIFCPGASVIHRQGASATTSTEVERHKHDGMLLYHEKHWSRSDSELKQWLLSSLVNAHFYFGEWVKKARQLRKQWFKTELLQIKQEFTALSVSDNTKPVVIITGAKSDVGDYLLSNLDKLDFQCIAVNRSSEFTSNDDVVWLNLDFFLKSSGNEIPEVYAWINLAPVWTTRSLTKIFHKFHPQNIITLSSTSIEGKSDSNHQQDREVVERLIDGEKWFEHYVQEYSINGVILRPTLIYGGPRNQNINFIASFIRYCRFFPLVGRGEGKRQPVHAEDVARLCVEILQNKTSGFKLYNVVGGEVLSYREMVDRVFHSMGRTKRYVRIPSWIIKPVVTLLSILPKLRFLNAEMVARIDKDLVYSMESVQKELGFKPRKFMTEHK